MLYYIMPLLAAMLFSICLVGVGFMLGLFFSHDAQYSRAKHRFVADTLQRVKQYKTEKEWQDLMDYVPRFVGFSAHDKV